MAWWGAGIGGTIGLLFGGPIGAIIGAGIGSTLTQDQTRLGSAEKKQLGFIVATFSMLGKIAKADGIVTQEEVAFVDRFIKGELQLDSRSRSVAIEIFHRAKTDTTSIYKYAEQLSEIFLYDEAMRETVYRVLFMTAMADGTLHPAEKEILELMPAYLHIRDDAFQLLEAELMGRRHGGGSGGGGKGRPSNGDLAQSYKILEIDETATDAEVKKAYRRKAQEYHPDKLASKGLPEGFTKFATEQMQLFSDAHDKIMKHRRNHG
ncbi:MAG: co-chaperone DjlA [Nitrospiria bacterium]